MLLLTTKMQVLQSLQNLQNSNIYKLTFLPYESESTMRDVEIDISTLFDYPFHIYQNA